MVLCVHVAGRGGVISRDVTWRDVGFDVAHDDKVKCDVVDYIVTGLCSASVI